MNTEYTATEIVKDMYDSYPEVDFIDENYTDDDRTVNLIFDISRVDDIQSLLTKIEDEYGCTYRTKGNGRLIITAIEDDEYYLDDTDYDMTERHDESLEEMWYTKANADSAVNGGYYSENRAKQDIADAGFTLDQIVPDMEKLYHIYQAKQKSDSGQTRGCGINYKSISDPIKFAQYIYAASVLGHRVYLNKIGNMYWSERPRTPNQGYFYENVCTAINYFGLQDTTLKQKFDKYLADREKLEKEKDARRQARAAKNPTKTTTTTTATTTPKNPGKITKQGWGSDTYYPDNIFQKVVDDGCNVDIGRIVSQDGNRRTAGSSYNVANVVARIDVTDKDTGEVLFGKEIISSAPSGSFEDGVRIYRSDEFRGLPERQFASWLKRKVDQVRNAPIGNPTDDATEAEDAETTEVQDED